VIWTAFALIISFVTGWLLVKILWPARKHDGAEWLLRLSLAAGLGLGVTSLVSFLVLLLRGRLGRLPELIGDSTLLVLLFAYWVLKRKTPSSGVLRSETASSRATLPMAAAFVLCLASNLAAFILLSRKEPHGNWDGWSIWNLHARFLFRGGQFWKDTFSPLLDYYKPDYPLLIPGSIARLWSYADHESVLAPALVAAIFTFALVLLLTSLVARLRGYTQGILAGLVLLGTPAFVDQGATQNADVAVAFFFLAMLGILCVYDYADQTSGYLVLAGLAAGMTAWTKNEGFMLLLIAIAARIAVFARAQGLRRLLRQNAPLLVGVTPVMLLILYFKACLVPVNDMVAGQGLHATLARLVSVSRYKVVLKAFAHHAISFGGWFAPILLVLAFYALLVGFDDNEKCRKPAIAAALTVATSAVGYLFVYIVTPHDVAWQLKWSLERVLMQLWPAAIFSAFVLMRTPDEAITNEVGTISGASARGT
jgi:4-amino-4-deoxy-L-arabinose transferase-like glycosyltransferase